MWEAMGSSSTRGAALGTWFTHKWDLNPSESGAVRRGQVWGGSWMFPTDKYLGKHEVWMSFHLPLFSSKAILPLGTSLLMMQTYSEIVSWQSKKNVAQLQGINTSHDSPDSHETYLSRYVRWSACPHVVQLCSPKIRSAQALLKRCHSFGLPPRFSGRTVAMEKNSETFYPPKSYPKYGNNGHLNYSSTHIYK